MCKMQIKPVWESSEDWLWSCLYSDQYSVWWLCTRGFPGLPQPPPSLPAGSPACGHVDSGQAGPSWREGGRLLRLGVWSCLISQSRAESILLACVEGREGKCTFIELYYTLGHLKPFICIFTHPRNQQGTWAKGDTTAWASSAGWCAAAAPSTRRRTVPGPEDVVNTMAFTYRLICLRGHWFSFDFPYLWGGRNDNIHKFSRGRKPDYRNFTNFLWTFSVDHIWGQTQWVRTVLGVFFF